MYRKIKDISRTAAVLPTFKSIGQTLLYLHEKLRNESVEWKGKTIGPIKLVSIKNSFSWWSLQSTHIRVEKWKILVNISS